MGRTHTFRFAVGFNFGADARNETMADTRELARKAEGLGYSTLLIGDHFLEFLPAGGASPLFALAAAAQVTTTLRVGAVVLGNDYRHPAVLAKDAATLDVMSDGRVEFGIGAGWYKPDYDALGLPYDPASVRLERLEQAIQIIRAAWRGEAFDFEGKHYTIRNYAALPIPVQQPMPITVGGGGPKVLRAAGRHGDVVGIHVRTGARDSAADTSRANTLRKIDWVREGAGPRFDDIELQMAVTVVLSDPASHAARLGMSVDQLRDSSMTLVGSVDGICEEIQRRRDEWGITYMIIPADTCEAFAPVVARLAGT